MIEKVDTPDKYTFKVTYKKPYAPALASWTTSILPSHLLKGVPVTQSELQRHPVGTGPYMFKEWDSARQITLSAFNGYFEGRANIDQYTMKIIPDTATMFLELLNRNIDMMELSPLQFARQTSNPQICKGIQQIQLPCKLVYLCRLQPKTQIFKYQKGKAGIILCNPKGRDHKRSNVWTCRTSRFTVQTRYSLVYR